MPPETVFYVAPFHDPAVYPDAVVQQETLVVRPEAELFFGNAEPIVEGIYSAAAETEPPVRFVLVDLEATSELDVPGAHALRMLADRLAEAGIPLAIARAHGPVTDMLERTGILDVLASRDVAVRVEDAVRTLEAS